MQNTIKRNFIVLRFILRFETNLSVPMMYPSLHFLLSNCYLSGAKKASEKRTINAVESLYILLFNSYPQTTRYYSNSIIITVFSKTDFLLALYVVKKFQLFHGLFWFLRICATILQPLSPTLYTHGRWGI